MFPTANSAHSVPQTPASIGVSFSYEKAVGNGAIMIVDGEVRVLRAGPTSQICKWMEAIAKTLLEKFEDAKTNGIWVITSTFFAPRSVVAALSSKATTFSWTVAAEAAAVGKIAPGGSWCSDRKDAAWIEHPNVSLRETG